MTQVDTGTPEAQAPEGAAEQPQQQQDFGPLLERMNDFGGQLGEIRERVEQFQPAEPGPVQQQPYQDPYGYGDPYAQQPGQPPYGPQQPVGPEQFAPEPQFGPGAGQVLYDANGYPVEIPGQQPQQQVDPEQAREQLAQMLGVDELRSEFQRMQTINRAREIEAQYPALQNRETVKTVTEQAAQRAQQIGQPELAANPEFVLMTYLAGRASDSAAGETPAGGADAIQLETPGGTSPEQPQLDEGDLIVAAMDARRPQW